MFPNPANDLVAIQVKGLLEENLTVTLVDMTGRTIQQKTLVAGSTILYFDTQTAYAGEYFLHINSTAGSIVKKLSIVK